MDNPIHITPEEFTLPAIMKNMYHDGKNYIGSMLLSFFNNQDNESDDPTNSEYNNKINESLMFLQLCGFFN